MGGHAEQYDSGTFESPAKYKKVFHSIINRLNPLLSASLFRLYIIHVATTSRHHSLYIFLVGGPPPTSRPRPQIGRDQEERRIMRAGLRTREVHVAILRGYNRL